MLDRLRNALRLNGSTTLHQSLMEQVEAEALELTNAARDLNTALERYKWSADPFTALIIDVHNRRVAARTSDPDWLGGLA